MNRRSHLILVSLLAAALVGVGLIGWPGSPLQDKVNLGLDLQGGLQVTLKAVPPKGRPLEKSDLDRSVSIMRSRVDKLGVAEPEIRTQGDDQIVIDLPGIRDPAAAAKIIGKTAALELYDLEVNLVPPSISAQNFPIAKGSVYDLLAGQQALALKGTPDTWYLFDAKRKVVAGPTATKEGALRKFKGELPKGYKPFPLPPPTPPTPTSPETIAAPPLSQGRRQPVAKESVFDLLAGQQALAKKGSPDTWYLFDTKKKVVAGPTATKEGALRKFKGELPKGYRLFAVPPEAVVISCGSAFRPLVKRGVSR